MPLPAFLNYRWLRLGVGTMGLLALLLALTTSLSAYAAPESPDTLAGTTWTGTTTFLQGSRQGQSQSITLTFASNGCVTVETDGGTGYGFWFRSSSGQFIYTFREMFSGMGDVQVVHALSFLRSNTFVSTGEGYLYDQNNQPDTTIHNMTRTQVTLER